METKAANRRTRWPGVGDDASIEHTDGHTNINRQTKFPGGIQFQQLSLLKPNDVPGQIKYETVLQPPARLPLKVNPVVGSLLGSSLEIVQAGPSTVTIEESPWSSYIALRNLKRGGEVIAACSQEAPVRMVAIKKLSSEHLRDLADCQHQNILKIEQTFRFEGLLYIVTDDTTTTLKQVIAIPLSLEELHVSAVCRQVINPNYIVRAWLIYVEFRRNGVSVKIWGQS